MEHSDEYPWSERVADERLVLAKRDACVLGLSRYSIHLLRSSVSGSRIKL